MTPLEMVKIRSEILKDLEGRHLSLDGDEGIATALCIASAIVGPNVRKCSTLLGVPEIRMSWMAQNLRRNGVWRGSRVNGDWLSEDGGLNLTLDACVALGLLDRASEKEGSNVE